MTTCQLMSHMHTIYTVLLCWWNSHQIAVISFPLEQVLKYQYNVLAHMSFDTFAKYYFSEKWMKISNITENHCHFYSLRQEIQIRRRLILTLTEDNNFHCLLLLLLLLSHFSLLMGYKSSPQSCTSHGWKWFNLHLIYWFPVKFSSHYLWPDKISSAVYNFLVGQDSHTTSVHNYLSTFMPDIFHCGTMKISLFMFNVCHLTAVPHHSNA